MFSEAQIRYVEDVLGVSLSYFQAVDEPVAAVVVVCADPLTVEARALLDKILASIQLRDFQVLEGDVAAARAHHVIHFAGGEDLGRVQEGEAVHWRLPAVREMLGHGPVVVEKKRAAWALLQQFQREKTQ